MTALLLCISLQSINQIKKAQEKHLLRLTATLQCPALALGIESSYWSITTFSQDMLSVDKNIKKCLNQGIKKMFSTTPKTGKTVLRKHKRWLFLWQKTAALSKWFKCSTILNKLLLLDEVEQNIVICQWQAINYLPKYFAITEFNNSFIIWSPSFFL